MVDSEAPPNAEIAIAASFVAEPLLPGVRLVLDEARLEVGVRLAPYHQVFQQLLSPASLLAANTSGIDIVLVRIEDYVRGFADVEAARTLLARTGVELLKALREHSKRARVPTVFGVLQPSPHASRALAADLEAASAALIEGARGLPGITLLAAEDIDLVSAGERYDSEADEIAHVPFTDEHYASLALAIVRKVHALRVPTRKVLVLDCDNTLWRGVVAEDGVEGIAIPPALAQVQRFAVREQARGTLVCLASKNAEGDVLEVLEKRPDMILKSSHIVAHRINWDAKSRNLESIARALNLGLDAFVYMDDNPVECAQMRAELPEVITLQLPSDDAVNSFLAHLWVFDKPVVTKEDADRTRLYRDNAARRTVEETATDIREFIASLGIMVQIAPPGAEEWPRAAQLSERTNQFNLTTLRRSEAQLRALQRDGSIVLRIRVSDRFGDYGLVGLVVAHASTDALVVDTFLLSCRVLGRGVEHAVLRRIGETARERGLSEVHLFYSPTSRNAPARAFIESIDAAAGSPTAGGLRYRIAASDACAVAHKPGQDPVEIMDARQSSETVGIARAGRPGIVDHSGLYAKLAHELVSGRAVLDAMRLRGRRTRTSAAMPATPATETERELLRIWQELLCVDTLGVEDDFASLGGTSLLAARLFAEIERRFGVRLRLTTILAAPTVRALAQRLEAHSASDAEAIVVLKGEGARNFFLVHDGDGETLLYMNLARSMPRDLAVYGIEPRRLPKIPLGHARVEDMAAFYVTEVRKLQPTGPYFVGGMCAGGVIAYEMAVQLQRVGESVALVAVLEAAAPQARKRSGLVAQQRLSRLRHALAEAYGSRAPLVVRLGSAARTAIRKFTNVLSWELIQSLKRVSVSARFLLLRMVLPRNRSWPRFVPGLTVREIYDSAASRYVPDSLRDVETLLVRAMAGRAADTPYREIYADETFGWRDVAGRLSVVDVEGGHSSMLQEPFAEKLAAAMSPYLAPEVPEDRRRAIVGARA